MRIFCYILPKAVKQNIVSVLSDGPERENTVNEAFVYVFQVNSLNFGYKRANLHKICLGNSDFTCKIVKVAFRVNNLNSFIIEGVKLKWELKFKEKIEPGRSNVIFLVSTDGNFPVWFDIPDQIIVRNRDLLHLALIKSDNLEKGKIIGTYSLNVDSKFL